MSGALRATGALIAFGAGVLAWHLDGNIAGWIVAVMLILLATASAEAGNHVRHGLSRPSHREATKEKAL